MTKIGVNSVPHTEEGHLLGKEVHEILQGSYRRFLPALQLAVSLNLTYAVDGRLPLTSAPFNPLCIWEDGCSLGP